MSQFLKDYVAGGLLMLLNLPRILLSVALIILPGFMVGGLIYLVSPWNGDGDVIGLAALLTSIFVCTGTRYGALVDAMWPSDSFDTYE